MIPPQELGKKTFTRVVRGYEPSEVDQYLNFLIEKYTDIYNQCEIYDKKIKIVLQKIAEIQEREDEIQNKEETISKTMTSTQEISDKRIEEARETADKILAEAAEEADRILENARERVRKVAEAVIKKTEGQIESAQKKSEDVYHASRVRCAKLLGNLKKEITVQRERMFALKSAADNFNLELSEAYRKQFDEIKSTMVYAPAIDFEKLSDTRLFNMIMEEINEDMAEIENKSENTELEYEFEKELAYLRNLRFADDRMEQYRAEKARLDRIASFEIEENGDADTDDKADNDIRSMSDTNEMNKNKIEAAEEDGDVKVFAGGGAGTSTAAAANTDEPASDPRVAAADRSSVHTAPIATKERGEAEEEGEEEELTISTYDSDDYQSSNYMYKNDEDSDDLDEDEDEIDSARGLLGFFKGFGKKKKRNVDDIDESDDIDDIDDIYGKLDDDDDGKALNIFEDLGEDEEEQ